MSNQSLRNKNLHREPVQIIAKNAAPVIAKVSECFCVNLWLMRTKSVPGQTLYADFDSAICFLIGGRLKLDYDENMAL